MFESALLRLLHGGRVTVHHLVGLDVEAHLIHRGLIARLCVVIRGLPPGVGTRIGQGCDLHCIRSKLGRLGNIDRRERVGNGRTDLAHMRIQGVGPRPKLLPGGHESLADRPVDGSMDRSFSHRLSRTLTVVAGRGHRWASGVAAMPRTRGRRHARGRPGLLRVHGGRGLRLLSSLLDIRVENRIRHEASVVLEPRVSTGFRLPIRQRRVSPSKRCHPSATSSCGS